MAKKLTITVDQDTCIGCTTCAAMCPSYFEMDMENGKAKPTVASAENAADFSDIRDAEDACPVDAIDTNEGEL